MWVVLLMGAVMLGVLMEGSGGAEETSVEDLDDILDSLDEALETGELSLPLLQDDPESDAEESDGSAADGSDDADADTDAARIFSVGSNDAVTGGDGDDVFLFDPDPVADPLSDAAGSVSSATVDGGDGDDVMLLFENNALFSLQGGSLSGGDGEDRIVASGVAVAIDGGAGDDIIETPVGGRLWDATVQGGDGDDTIDVTWQNGDGFASLNGGAGDDLIDIRNSVNTNTIAQGDDGNDTIRVGPDLHFSGTGYVTGGDGGAGDDLLLQDADLREALQWRPGQTVPMSMTGGEGADTFQLNTTSSSGLVAAYDGAPDVLQHEWMVINDFEVGTDMIVFDFSDIGGGFHAASSAQMVEDTAAGETQVSVLLESESVEDLEMIITVDATGLDWGDVSFIGAAPTLAAPTTA